MPSLPAVGTWGHLFSLSPNFLKVKYNFTCPAYLPHMVVRIYNIPTHMVTAFFSPICKGLFWTVTSWRGGNGL